MKLSLFINIVAIVIVDLLVVLFFWARQASPETIITILTASLPIEVLVLNAGDLAHKLVVRHRVIKINSMAPGDKSVWLAEHKDDVNLIDRLNVAYYGGSLCVLLAVVSFYWASMEPTFVEARRGIGMAMFFSLLGLLWMFLIYKPSSQTDEEKGAEKWDKGRRKWRKAKTPEDRLAVLGCYCQYNFVNDTVGNPLDFSRPLARYKNKNLTYAQLAKKAEKVGSESLKAQVDAVEETLRYLVG